MVYVTRGFYRIYYTVWYDKGEREKERKRAIDESVLIITLVTTREREREREMRLLDTLDWLRDKLSVYQQISFPNLPCVVTVATSLSPRFQREFFSSFVCDHWFESHISFECTLHRVIWKTALFSVTGLSLCLCPFVAFQLTKRHSFSLSLFLSLLTLSPVSTLCTMRCASKFLQWLDMTCGIYVC